VAASVTDTAKRKLIKQRVAYWQERLLLQNWSIHLRWKHKLLDDKKIVAYVKTDVNYRIAKIYFILPAITNNVISRIGEFVLHELLHVVNAEYDWLIEEFVSAYPNALYYKVREQTTEHLTRIILEGGKK
jgi:hypothetical protein